ncbi:MAG: metal ABC transporter permease, partial [Patescibacteria group bacterium]
AVVSALLIEELRRKNLSGETALSLFLSGGLALAVVLIGFKRGFNVDIFSYLFGSIATVSESDLFIIGILGIVTVLTVKMLYKELLYTVFNEEMARVSGMSTHMLNFVLTTLTAVVVVASIRIVGVLLIGALMVIPVVTASLISKSFKQTLLLSVVLSLCVVITGLFASYYFNVPAGGSIVLLALGVFGLVSINKKGSW